MATGVVNIRMRQVVRCLSDADAFSPDTARDVAALGLKPRLRHKQALWYLKMRGALVETEPGVYYIDEDALQRTGRLQRKILGMLMVVAVFTIVLITILGW